MAEAHPVGFRWVMKAKERGATVIHVDPRYSRTSALADQHVPIRAGIRHRLPRRADPPRDRDRVVLQGLRPRTTRTRRRSSTRTSRTPRTSAASSPASTRRPAPTTARPGSTRAARSPSAAGQREHSTQAFEERTGAGMMTGKVKRDETLQHPRCVFQILKRHFSRYTPEMVEQICGISPEDFQRGRRRAVPQLGPRAHHRVRLRRRLDAAHRRRADDPHGGDPAAAARQHRAAPAAASWRCAATRRSRARPTCRRSTTCCPATCTCRKAREDEQTLEDYIETGGADKGWWSFFDKYIVSLLKAWFGDAATEENDYGFRLPAEDHRQPLALRDDAARARRRPRRAVPDGPEPGGRVAALGPAAARARVAALAGRARAVGDRVGELLEGLARGRSPAS